MMIPPLKVSTKTNQLKVDAKNVSNKICKFSL